MGKLKLREVAQASENGATAGGSVTLKPLKVSGVLVGKADLIEALRVYVNLRDIQVTEDGELFILIVGEGGDREDPTPR